MHGSSSVPQELQDIINAHGGQMPQTYGVPVEEIERGIRQGVRKVNIDTDCRMAMTGQFRKVAQEHPEEFDPRKFLIPAMDGAGGSSAATGSSDSAPPATPSGSRPSPMDEMASALRLGRARPASPRAVAA